VNDKVRIEKSLLTSQVIDALEANNVPKEQAEVVADCFVTADACGIDTHGLSVLSSHIDRIKRNAYNLDPRFEILKSTHSFSVIDQDNAIGPYGASFCMKTAMKHAKTEGIYIVHARNCNTYGAAFYYTYLAVQEELIGITFSNSPAAMPAWGGKTKLLGTNPLAVGIPGKDRGPILFDMATSKVAKSKINQARINGEKIPDDWALDINGNKTNDPIEAINGLLLPIAQHKGYGLALSIDILAGILSGAAYSTGVNKFYSSEGKCMNVGQVFVAIDPKIILSSEFYENVDDYILKIKTSVPIEENPVMFPGERKLNNLEFSNKHGVEISQTLYEKIIACNL